MTEYEENLKDLIEKELECKASYVETEPVTEFFQGKLGLGWTRCHLQSFGSFQREKVLCVELQRAGGKRHKIRQGAYHSRTSTRRLCEEGGSSGDSEWTAEIEGYKKGK